MDWAMLYFEAALAFVVIVLMGIILLAAAGVRNAKAVIICAPLASMACLGILSIGSSIFAWSLPYVALGAFSLVAILLAARLIVDRARFASQLGEQMQGLRSQGSQLVRNRVFLTALGGILIASLLTACILSGISLASPIGFNSYDGPFHYSVVRHILDSGNASPIGAGSVMGTEHAVYPDLWHAVTALLALAFGQTIVVEGWVSCLVFMAFLAPAGVTALAFALFKTRSVVFALLAPLVTALMPYSMFMLLGAGCLFANLAGLTMLPLALAMPIRIAGAGRPGERRPSSRRTLSMLMPSVVPSILALGLAHPSTVIIYVLVLVPLCIARAQKVASKLVIGLGAAAVWLLLQATPLFSRTVNCLDRVDRDREIGAQLAGMLGLDYPALESSAWLPFALFLIVAGIGIACAFLLRKKWDNSWYLACMALLSAIAVTTCFPMDRLTVIVSGYFYRDFARVVIFLFFLSSPLLAALPAWLLQSASTRLKGRARVLALIALGIILVLCLGWRAERAFHTRAHYEALTTPEATLTAAQIEYLEQVARIVGEGTVLNNDTDDSRWLYPIYDVSALLKGNPASQMSSMDESYCSLIENIGAYGADTDAGQKAREAARQLHVGYVTKMTDNPIVTMRFNDASQIDYAYSDSIRAVTDETPGFELVYELDGMKLYKLSETG